MPFRRLVSAICVALAVMVVLSVVWAIIIDDTGEPSSIFFMLTVLAALASGIYVWSRSSPRLRRKLTSIQSVRARQP
jgi:hypothetical protein